MSLPQPPVPMKNPCSVVHDHTLYVYTVDALQSISLTKGSKWKKLPGGVSVSGATCVKAVPHGDDAQAAMYTIGGSTGSASEQFSGLQRYSFAQRKWETLPLEASVAQNRRDHGAAYINSTSSILIYGGSQTGPSGTLSSETFLLDTNSPYSITSFSSKAPPVADPLLLPFNSTHAAMLGGDPTNKQIYLFSNDTGWTDLGMTLQEGLPSKSQAQAAFVDGDDGSKMLETFDMSKNPNVMTRTVMLGPGGSVSSSASPVKKRVLQSKRHVPGPPPLKRRKRDLKLSNWPTYNGSLAPKTTRSGFSLAQDSDDQVVIAGGNDDDPFVIFNPRQNEWVDAKQLMGVPNDDSSPSASPSSATPSASSTALPPPGTGTQPNPNVRSKSLTILGATLGAIFGLAIILILALLFLRWRRKKRQFDEAGHQRRASGVVGDDKDRMSFADRGASFMSEAGGYMGRTQNHESVQSTSSAAIMAGRAGKGHTRGLFSKGGKGRSPLAETISLEPASHDRAAVSFAPTPVPPADGAVRARGTDGNGKQRSSGWSRYFSGNSATNLVHMNSSRSAGTSHSHSSQGSQTPIADSMAREREREREAESERERESATVAPLRLGAPFGSAPGEVNQVVSSSPRISGGNGVALSDGMSGRIARQNSNGSTVSSMSGHDATDAFSSGIPASIHEDSTWTPVGREAWNSSDRIASSVYTDSARGSTAVNVNMPGVVGPGPRFGGSDARDSTATMFPRPPQGVPPPGATRGGTGGAGFFGARGRGGGGGGGSGYDDQDEGSVGGHYSDMSWLNLSNTRE